MLIPHSEKRVFHFQLNAFAIVLVLLLLSVAAVGFFGLASVHSSSERLTRQTTDRLQSAEASLEQVRQEVRDFVQVYEDFEQALRRTLQRLDLAGDGSGDARPAGGDLAALLNLVEIRDGDLQEIMDLQRVVASLRDSVAPLHEISEVLELNRQLLGDIPNYWPIMNGLGVVTMEFGPNIHPISGVWYMHKGIDIATRPGTPVVAAANGTVVDSGVDRVGGYGGYVEINHNYGFRTKYGHLQDFYVSEGDDVVQGQVIGTVGSTGLSTGPHLDFQIWIGTENVDPAHFLKLNRPDFTRIRISRR